MFFTKDILNSYSQDTDLLALAVIERFFPDSGIDVNARRLSILGISAVRDVAESVPRHYSWTISRLAHPGCLSSLT